jgi:hypothetical protein
VKPVSVTDGRMPADLHMRMKKAVIANRDRTINHAVRAYHNTLAQNDFIANDCCVMNFS